MSRRDVAAIRQLLIEYAAWMDIDLCCQNFDRELETLPRDYTSPRGALLPAETGVCVVGCVGLRPLVPDLGEIKRLYVRPDHRAAGTGRGLMTALIERAHHAGHRAVRLDTIPKMGAARRLYRELGFAVIPPYYFNPIAGKVYLELRPDARRGTEPAES